MVSREEEKYVVWSVYFDKSVSRLNGRKVSKKYAKSLGLNPILEKESTYPKRNWKKEGRVLIDKKDSKSKLLRQIANRL
jgi:signal recognition particle subunit SEC65